MASSFKPVTAKRALVVGSCALVFALIFSLPLLKHLTDPYSADDWHHWRDFEWEPTAPAAIDTRMPGLRSSYRFVGVDPIAVHSGAIIRKR